ncbi:MAG: hypothetical protein L0H96_18360 [Humibacillus sp.]|nr:hypothetical protein [Humibacillus sp.]
MTGPAKGEPSGWLAALEAKFVAEDREDRRAERARRRAGLPEPDRDVQTFDGFAQSGARARET